LPTGAGAPILSYLGVNEDMMRKTFFKRMGALDAGAG